jgi:hypothetical protein
MKKGDSHNSIKGRRPSGEALWTGAAVAGLLLIGLLLGGVGGVFLDRQGLLGHDPAPAVIAEVPRVPALPAPAVPRVLSAAPEIDRETLTHLMERCHGDARPDCPILQGLAGKVAQPAGS